MRWKDHFLCADNSFDGGDHSLFEGSVTTFAGLTTEIHKRAGNFFSFELEAPRT
jgi:hypothetical protein